MNRYTTLFESLGATPRPGADEAALARAEEAQGVRFPENVREFYRATDGLVLPDLDLEILPLSSFGPIAGPLNEGHGYAPFTESDGANLYAICCAGPLFGFVVHLYDDNEPVLVCRSLGRFFDLLVERRLQMFAADKEIDPCVYDLEGDLAFDRPERTADDARVGDELIRYADRFTPRDGERHDALRFAAQMFGPGHEAELTRVLAAGDEYAREAVLERWHGLGTAAAEVLLRRDAEDFDQFVEDLAKAVVAAGMEIRRHPPPGYGFTITPGNLGVHFKRHFCKRHQPGFLPELVELLRRWQWEKTAEPIDRLARSGLVESWVESRRGEWDHAAWGAFMRDATWRFGALPADRVGLLLEEEKRRYWDRRRAADGPGSPS
jgi:hypothetical protein